MIHIFFDLDDTCMDTTGILGGSLMNLAKIRPFKGLVRILKRQDCINYLVSCGAAHIQRKKIKLLKIANYFRSVRICLEASDKLILFMAIAKDVCPKERRRIVVVGNRIDVEIRYGNLLGFHTVHIQHGKYANLRPRCKDEVPNYVIGEISDLGRILDRIGRY